MKRMVLDSMVKAIDVRFEESKHPRSDDGKFTSGSGSGSHLDGTTPEDKKAGGRVSHRFEHKHIAPLGKGTTYNCADYTLNGHKYRINAKCHETESDYGINGGRVSKLSVKRDGKIVARYDRGWDNEGHFDSDTMKVIEDYLLERNGSGEPA